MAITVLLWILFVTACVYAAYLGYVRFSSKRRMMSHVHTVHGHILKSTLDTKSQTGVGNVGATITSSGDYMTHFSYKTYHLKSGFTVHFLENFTMKDIWEGHKSIQDQPVTLFGSLNKDQEDPFLKHYVQGRLESLDGTLSYVIDGNGNKRYMGFTPDA